MKSLYLLWFLSGALLSLLATFIGSKISFYFTDQKYVKEQKELNEKINKMRTDYFNNYGEYLPDYRGLILPENRQAEETDCRHIYREFQWRCKVCWICGDGKIKT